MAKNVCVKCHCEFRVKESGAYVIEMASFGPYKVWSADIKACPGCGFEIVSGFGNSPVREDHYKDDFPNWLNALIQRCKEHGVSVIYDYERPQN